MNRCFACLLFITFHAIPYSRSVALFLRLILIWNAHHLLFCCCLFLFLITWQWKLSSRQMQLHAYVRTPNLLCMVKFQMRPSLNCWACKWFDQMLLKTRRSNKFDVNEPQHQTLYLLFYSRIISKEMLMKMKIYRKKTFETKVREPETCSHTM